MAPLSPPSLARGVWLPAAQASRTRSAPSRPPRELRCCAICLWISCCSSKTVSLRSCSPRGESPPRALIARSCQTELCVTPASDNTSERASDVGVASPWLDGIRGNGGGVRARRTALTGGAASLACSAASSPQLRGSADQACSRCGRCPRTPESSCCNAFTSTASRPTSCSLSCSWSCSSSTLRLACSRDAEREWFCSRTLCRSSPP
mmetsp:Transcript_18451/g.37613  ORF Transcript_18451/g.37613 Transcript_18451/m.37613 type:complete len:207 (-) Transcript_18451:605-1225(-)